MLEERAFALLLGAILRVVEDVDLAWRLTELAAYGAVPMTPPKD